MSYKDLRRNAAIADTETLGLTRSEGLNEVAIFNLETREASEFIKAYKEKMAAAEKKKVAIKQAKLNKLVGYKL
jgi:hypothetical protein